VLTVGSLFSGIGGFDLGLERAGMRTVWFCEQDEFCRRVLAKHWPGVPCHPDVRALVADTDRKRLQTAAILREAANGLDHGSDESVPGGRVVPVSVPYVDVLCGGFPCQDLSYAGKGAGLDGERSGLWSEYARLIRDLRPRYVIVENVSALLARGLGRVLGDLAACGYDAEWDCIPASAIGAPHRRDRVWLIAYPNGEGEHDGAFSAEVGGASESLAYPARDVRPERAQGWTERERAWASRESSALGDADRMAGSSPIAGNGRSETLARPEQVERAIGSGWQPRGLLAR
jgi:DNA-cytosine methyltransferase